MSKINFFTDIDLLKPQSFGNEFGYTEQSNGYDTFQVTSQHAASTKPSAYAVCDGVVFVQEVANTGGTHVNLILQPTQQPPFAFPKVKFFIYRGILKDSLISGTEIAPSNTNDLTKTIWDSQAAMNASANTNDNPQQGALGIDLISTVTGFADTDPIDNAFYRTAVDSQLPMVRAGWAIGSFDSAGFGFEIMLESVGFNPTLDVIRNAENNINTIKVTTLASSPTQPQFFEHWHDKEEILNYADPCAFFGSFSAYKNKLEVPSTSGTSTKKGNAVYDDVLDEKFSNKNNVYIDIRNEYNFSINYFKNYGASLTDVQTEVTVYDANTASSTRDYYAGNWPLLIMKPADFNATNTSNNKNVINIALPDGNGENTLPILYISAGTLATDFPRETKGKNKLIDVTVTNNYTDEIAIATPNRDGLSNTTPISFYVRLKYLKRLDVNPPASSDTVIRAQNYLDNLFAPFDMRIPFSGNVKIKSIVFDEEMFVDAKEELGISYIGTLGIGRDLSKISFFCYPIIIQNNIAPNYSLIGEKSTAADDFFKELIINHGNMMITSSQLYLCNGNKTILNFDDKLFMENYNITKENFRDSVFIVLTINDFNTFSSLSSAFIPKYRIYLSVENKNSLLDSNDQSYTELELVLIGHSLLNNQISVNKISTNIKAFAYGNI